jgi:hypothetical protein
MARAPGCVLYIAQNRSSSDNGTPNGAGGAAAVPIQRCFSFFNVDLLHMGFASPAPSAPHLPRHRMSSNQ